jgi:histone deacetylase 1/2
MVAPLADLDEITPALYSEARKKSVIQNSDRMILRSKNKLAASIFLAEIGASTIESESDEDKAFYNMLVVRALAANAGRLTVRKALNSDEKTQWVEAIRAEIFSLITETETFVPEVIDTSKDYLLINTTMQLKKKMKDANTLDKFKARCCGCGNELKGLVSETFSPTVSALAHSVLHQLAVMDGMEVSTMDTVAAYLNQHYPQDITPLYVTLPKLVAEVCNLDPNQTYRVKKYIYGLPDAGRAYYIAYRNHLIQNEYIPTASDPCLFVKFIDGEKTFIWFHVDDSFVASTTRKGIDAFATMLRSRFQITVNNAADVHLGINMKKLKDGSIRLTQPKLLKQIFDEYSPNTMQKSKGVSVPMRSTSIENDDDDTRDDEYREERIAEFLHLLGMLNYLTRSRPDISTALSFAATHSNSPTSENFQQLLDVVRYLWDTQEKGLVVRSGVPGQPLLLTCYVDASYLTHEDSKSHTGYCLSFGEIGTFHVKSSKQQLVATSSTHAEVRALYQLVLDIVFVVNLCDELRRPVELPAIVFEDNQPTINLSANLSARIKKCKHFLMLINYIREQVAVGLIEIRKIPTEDNPADLLTKKLTGIAFTQKADWLLGISDDEFVSDI